MWSVGQENLKRLKKEVFAIWGGKCVRCGFKDKRALQIDHKFGGGTAEKRALGNYRLLQKVLNDPSDYQLLCANCNWIKRHQRGEHRGKSKKIQPLQIQRRKINLKAGKILN
jgi:hypothetical protein